MTETLAGIGAGILYIFIVLLLRKYFMPKLLAATTLVAIAFIYVGFSLKDNPANLIALEVAFALALFFVAIIGYTRYNLLIAYGIVIHGLWDILHHNGIPIQTDIPGYWPTFCFLIDIIDGVFFIFLFRKQNPKIL